MSIENPKIGEMKTVKYPREYDEVEVVVYEWNGIEWVPIYDSFGIQ